MNGILNFKQITKNEHCAKPAEKQAMSITNKLKKTERMTNLLQENIEMKCQHIKYQKSCFLANARTENENETLNLETKIKDKI